jgi:cob(I)alamin adenosyltransferase
MAQAYTGRGDTGKTDLFGTGKRESKSSDRIYTIGSADETNSLVGLAISRIKNKGIQLILGQIQEDLFVVGADLANTRKIKRVKVTNEMVKKIEMHANKLNAELPPLTKFIMPGGSPGASVLHVARSVCRRAERDVVRLSKKEHVNPKIVKYLNRLSSLLFVLARYINKLENSKEKEWLAK